MRTINKLITLSALTTSIQVFATDATFHADAQIGLTTNSDLAIKELDDISSQSDTGSILKAGVSAELHATDNLKFTPSYRYEQTNYHQLDQYDLALHQYSLDSSYSLSGTDVGIRYDGALAKVAKETFLTLDQVSLYVGHYFNPTTYLRTAIRASDKQFATQSMRDAKGLGLDSNLYYFINQGKTMLLLGASLDRENADSEQFNFKSWGLNTGITHRFKAFDISNKAGLSWRYQDKNYQEVINQSLTQSEPSRDESRSVVSAFWQLSVFDSLQIVTEAEYGDYQSKLAANTYTQSIASLSLKASF